MKKRKLIIISVVVLATMIVGAGSAFAFNGNQGANLEDKLEAIEERVDEGDMTRDEADAIIEQISSCDADCDGSGECADRPEEGRGIFGNGAKDGTGFRNGARDGMGNGAGNGQNRGRNGICDGTCDVDSEA